MAGRVSRSPRLAEEPRPVVVPVAWLDGGEPESTLRVPGGSVLPADAERERVLALALREFEHRWEERERNHAEAIHEAESRAAEVGRTAITVAVERLTGVVEEMLLQRDEIFQSAEETVVRLALAIARRVIGDAVALDDKLVLETVGRALRHATEAQWVVIRVHPGDLQLVEQHASQWSDLAQRSRSLKIEADTRIRPGGCILETDAGQVAAELEEQVRTLEAALIERVR